MKKHTLSAIIAVSALLSASTGLYACKINVINDTRRPVTITMQNGETMSVARKSNVTFGRSDQKANFNLTKQVNGKQATYQMQQTSCSSSHLIDVRASRIGRGTQSHFSVTQEGGRAATHDAGGHSCSCRHK